MYVRILLALSCTINTMWLNYSKKNMYLFFLGVAVDTSRSEVVIII